MKMKMKMKMKMLWCPTCLVALQLTRGRAVQGTYFDASLQECVPCDAKLVSLSSGATSCVPCSAAEARVNASTCSLCPDYSKAPLTEPGRCACTPGYYDALYGSSLLAPLCLPCPLGGSCNTGFVAAAPNFWRESTRSAVFYKCREGRCVAENVTGPLSDDWSSADSLAAAAWASVLPANVSSAVLDDSPANCVAGSTGPLCGLCLPGYAVQSGECAPCNPKDAWENWSKGAKGGLLIACLLFAIVFVAFAFFQPIVPAFENTFNGALAAGRAAPSHAPNHV